MAMFWQEFKNGGSFNYLILLFGVVGILAGSGCALVAARRESFGRWLGIGVVGLAFGILSIGFAGVMFNRSTTDAALSAGGLSANQAERIKRAGYDESKSCAKFGLGFALIPLLGGIAAILAAKRKGPPASPVLALVVIGVTLVPTVANAFLIVQPLPGRDIAPDDPTWDLLDAEEHIRSGKIQVGCDRLEDSLDVQKQSFYAGKEVKADPSKVSNYEALLSACVDARIAEARAASTPTQQRRALAEIKSLKVAASPAAKKRIDDEIAKIAAQ